MKIYYYVHTGHRIGLDRFRRACAILNALGNDEVTLLCSDFRIAQIARDFGVKKSVGVDVVRNIPYIAEHGDKIIFDSEEANPIMLADMRNFFSTFIRVSDKIEDKKESNEFLISPYIKGDDILTTYAVDKKFFTPHVESSKISIFFGDDDYSKDLMANLSFFDGIKASLQLGFYYFLDYGEELEKLFDSSYEFEDYEEMIKESGVLITSSPQAILESLASGNRPIYFQREDYADDVTQLFNKLSIPTISNYNSDELNTILNTIKSHNYEKIEDNSNIIKTFLNKALNL